MFNSPLFNLDIAQRELQDRRADADRERCARNAR
jgi:hypothetical protein